MVSMVRNPLREIYFIISLSLEATGHGNLPEGRKIIYKNNGIKFIANFVH